MIEFNVLGPLVVRRDGVRIAVPTLMLRRLLAVFLARPGIPLSTDVIIDALWPDQPPPSARRSLSAYLSRLRALLGEDDRVQAVQGTYALSPRDDELDSYVFLRLLETAAEADQREDPDGAARALGDALALWRGPAFENLIDLGPVLTAADQLTQLRLTALERWADIEIGQGRYAHVIGPLDEMIAAYPYRERLRHQRMMALYRDGRQAEALETYRETYQLLDHDLGILPTEELSQLHRRILGGDDVSVAAPSSAATGIVPLQLPPVPRGFVGRIDELHGLDAFLARSAADPAVLPIVTLSGMAGVGKTSLALRWAHHVRDLYPDGQLYVDLRGNTVEGQLAPISILASVLKVLGVKPHEVPEDLAEASALYRSIVASRRIMIVLDNAQSTEQVRSLLPGGSGCLAIVTSRHRLGELEVHTGAFGRRLDVLQPADAEQLISGLIDPEHALAEAAVIVEIAQLCAYLPLALRIAAARISEHLDQGIAWYRNELASADRLDALSLSDGSQVAVRAAFDLSYRLIPDPEQRLFRLLGIVPGLDFSAEAVAALADLPVSEAKRRLARLAGVHLIRQPAVDRYDFHDLIREFAQDLATGDADRVAARDRLYGWYASSAYAAATSAFGNYALLPNDAATTIPTEFESGGQTQTMAWFHREYANLVAAVTTGIANGNAYATTRIADSLRPYLQLLANPSEWLLVADAAAEAARRIDDVAAEGSAELSRASVYGTRSDYARSAGYLRTAIELCRRGGWQRGEWAARSNLATIVGITGDLHEAYESLCDLVDVADRSGLVSAAQSSVCNLGNTLLAMGRLDEALRWFRIGLARVADHRVTTTEVDMLDSAGVALRGLGRLDEARESLTRALTFQRSYRNSTSEAVVLAHLSAVARDQGHVHEAEDLVGLALTKVENRGVERIEAEVLNHSVPLDMMAGRLQPALAHATRAHDLARTVSARGAEIVALTNIGAVHRAMGDDETAYRFGRQAFELADRLGYRALARDAEELVERARPDAPVTESH